MKQKVDTITVNYGTWSRTLFVSHITEIREHIVDPCARKAKIKGCDIILDNKEGCYLEGISKRDLMAKLYDEIQDVTIYEKNDDFEIEELW